MKRINNYDNFFLPSNNLDESISFYSKIGLTEKFNFPEKGMVAFSVGSEEPAIILKDVTKFPTQKPTIWFVVDNVRHTYDLMKKEGIKFSSEPYVIGTGTAVEFEDPSGNVLGITDYR